MRTIKFRAKRIDNGEWVYGHYFQSPLTAEVSGTRYEDGTFFLSDTVTRHCIESDHVVYIIDESTLGQFTGLKDKNGVEIYEGDVLEYNQGLFGELSRIKERNVVKWICGGFRINTTYLSIVTEHTPDGLGFEPEVIGNVTDNKELLS